ncbi:hypothetical protein BGZ52_000026 [Haplosporangium bisporale]|nr:hypothetical protein BGZ52_000026 [Haplosporangium bisporale]
MIYKTTPATTLYLHHRSEDNVAGYRYHDSDNDWIITREQDEQDVLDLDISELKEKKAYLQWKDVFWLRHQAAFDALKAAVTSAKVLYIFDSDLPISVETDASGFVLGAVLFQTDTHSGTLTHHLIVIISEEEEEEEEEEEHSQEHDDDPEYLFDHDSFGENDDQDRLPFDYLGDLLVARARTLTELSLRGCSLRGFDLWEDLSSPSITPPILALRRLSLAETSVKSSDVVVLLKQCPELKELDLSGNFEPSWDSFPWSILHATQLTRLNLSQMCIDNKQLAQALLDCKGLASLIASQSNIQDTVLDTVVESLDGLVELDVSWCPEISEAAVARMLQRAATLKSLKLSWCAGVQSTIFRVPWACTRLEILEAQGLDRPPKEGRIGPNNVHDRVKQDEGEEEDELECDRAMFVQLSSLTELHRLVVGSSTTIISVSHGFGLMRWLSKLQELVLVGDDAHPMRLEELRLVAQFPHLSSFEFSLGLVDSAGQTALAGMKPSLKQQEQEIYF